MWHGGWVARGWRTDHGGEGRRGEGMGGARACVTTDDARVRVRELRRLVPCCSFMFRILLQSLAFRRVAARVAESCFLSCSFFLSPS